MSGGRQSGITIRHPRYHRAMNVGGGVVAIVLSCYGLLIPLVSSDPSPHDLASLAGLAALAIVGLALVIIALRQKLVANENGITTTSVRTHRRAWSEISQFETTRTVKGRYEVVAVSRGASLRLTPTSRASREDVDATTATLNAMLAGGEP